MIRENGAVVPNAAERLVTWMAREVRDDDVAVVGVGTPVALAALLLARTLHAPGVRLMMPGALDPGCSDLSVYVSDPVAAMATGRARLSRLDILDAIAAGDVGLQFVRPAQVDGRLRLNTERLHAPSGLLHLVGPIALPDVVARIRRVVAYVPRHDAAALVDQLDAVTAPREDAGGQVAALITPLALFRASSGAAVITGRAERTTVDELRLLTGFPLLLEGELPVEPEPTPAELFALRSVVDPRGLIGLEDPDLRSEARRTLAVLWSDGYTHPAAAGESL